MKEKIHSFEEFSVTLSDEVDAKLVFIAQNSPPETIPVIVYLHDSGFERLPNGSHLGGTGPIFDFGLVALKNLDKEKHIFINVDSKVIGVSKITLEKMAGSTLEIQERRFGRKRDRVAHVIWRVREKSDSDPIDTDNPVNAPENPKNQLDD